MGISPFNQRQSGLSLIGEIPWGTHFCQFYQSPEDLLEITVPYLKAGLENNESCVWVVAPPLTVEKAQRILAKTVPGLKQYINKGQIEFISLNQWYDGNPQTSNLTPRRLDKAISSGFDGLRLAFNYHSAAYAGANRDIADFSHYNILALLAYPRDEFDAIGLMEMVKEHRCALVRNAANWEIIESSEARIVRDSLEQSEKKFRFVFSNMAEGFAYHRIVLDDHGRPCDYIFLEINETFEKIVGLKAQNIMGKRVTEVLPGIDKDPTDWIGRYGQVALTGNPTHFESYSQVLDRWYAVSAFSPQKGFFGVTFSDITDRKRGEEALKVNNERLEILSETSALLLSGGTPESLVQSIANKVMTHLGCDCFFNFIADEKAGKLKLNAYAGISLEVAKTIEWLNYGEAICGCAARDGCCIVSENVQENGDPRAGLIRSFGIQAYAAHPLKIGDVTCGTLSFGTRTRTMFTEDELELMKTVAGQVSMAIERKRSEEALKQRTLELEAANKELESFSYSVSHDLRAPLRSMDGFSQALLEDYLDKLDPQGQDWLRVIRRSSQRMAELIDDILTLSRVVRAELQFRSVNLSELAASIITELQESQPERKVEFKIAPALEAYGDARLLKLALTNLLGNAFKFTARNPTACVEMGLIEIDEQSYYFIKDNGVGFDMAYADKLFYPFQRLHSDKEFPGTGIGLATVKRIIERHGGTLRAEGEVNQGATFYFSLNRGSQ